MKPDNPTKVDRAFDFTITETEERADGDGLNLEGYAAVFNSPTEINSWEGTFTETIAPGAFKRSIGDKMPVMQFDHGKHPMIGGLPIGVIRSLTEDSRGLKVKARLSDNWLIQPVRDAIRDGAISGMSFRFSVRDEEWDGDNRTIKAVDLHEVGPVVFPAYQATTVGVRSADSDPIFQLVELIRADESLRGPLAAALTFGASEDLADDGASPDLADGTEQPEKVAEVTEGPIHSRRSELLELADFMERAALNRERSRLL